MRHRSRPLHPEAWLRRARAAFIELRGAAAAAERQRAIDALPIVVFRGLPLHRLRCHGDYGRGPHDYNVPAALLWTLIDLRHFVCAFHTR